MPELCDNLKLRYKNWWAYLGIPAALRDDFKNKTAFCCSMKTGDYSVALLTSRPVIQLWREQLDAARNAKLGDRDAIIVKYNRHYTAARKGANGYNTFFDIMDWLLQKDGGMSALTQRATLLANNQLAAVARSAPRGAQASTALHQITDAVLPDADLPLDKYCDDYLAEAKITKDGARRNVALVREIAADLKMGIEKLQTREGMMAIQEWFKNKAIDNKWTESSTKTMMSRAGAYWRWMHATGKVLTMLGPFHGRFVHRGRDPNVPMKGRKGAGPAFDTAILPKMWRYAETKWRNMDKKKKKLPGWVLSAFLQIDAYTGIRRSGIMGLTKANVETERGYRHIHVREKIRGDSEAGDRRITIHSKLAPLIDKLMAMPGEYLLPIPAMTYKGAHAPATRAQYITQSMESLVEQMGLKKGSGAHAVRKAFQHMLQEAGVEKALRQQIFGHKPKDIIDDPDIYGMHYPFKKVEEAIEKINYPGTGPRNPPGQKGHSKRR